MKRVTEYKELAGKLFNLKEAPSGAPIAQPKDKRVNMEPRTQPMGTPPQAAAVGKEPNKHEDEYEDDIVHMDDDPVQPAKSRLGKIITHALGSDVEEPKKKSVKKEADQPHALSHGGGTTALPNKTHTELHDAELSPKEVQLIDKNEKGIMAFAHKVFTAKPLGQARRALCAKLEAMGIENKNSGKVADILIHMYHLDTSPETHIFQRALPRIAQMPNIKGGGFYQGGSPGPWQPLG